MKVKVNRELGCKNGGYPGCLGYEEIFLLSCKDGTKLTAPYLGNWTLDTLEEQWRLKKDFKGCACPDGIMPRWVKNCLLFCQPEMDKPKKLCGVASLLF